MKSQIDIILALESKTQRKRRAIFKTRGSKGCTASEDCTVSSSRRAQGWMTIGARRQGRRGRNRTSGAVLQWVVIPSEAGADRKQRELHSAKTCISFLCQKQVKCNGCFLTCWLAFLYELQECLQETSIIDQEVQPPHLLAAVKLVTVKSP